jgi:hypothetical protein
MQTPLWIMCFLCRFFRNYLPIFKKIYYHFCFLKSPQLHLLYTQSVTFLTLHTYEILLQHCDDLFDNPIACFEIHNIYKGSFVKREIAELLFYILLQY